MPLDAALRSLASTSAFASRALLPLFVLALIARFPALVSWLPFVGPHPITLPPSLAWLASDTGLLVIGLLALAEAWADQDPDARAFLHHVEPFLKAGVALFTTLALVEPRARAVAGLLGGEPRAGQATAWGWSLLVAAIVLVLAWMRRGVLSHVHLADAEGSLGLGRFLSRLETAWAALAIVLAFVTPLLTIALGLALLGVAELARRAIEAGEEARRIPCPRCAGPARPEALVCHACRAALVPVRAASSRAWPDAWFRSVPPGERDRERGLDLLALGRCPACAERRAPGELLAASPHACGWPAAVPSVPGAEWPSELPRHLARRAHRLAIPVAALGLVPIVGGAVALVLGRLRIAAPLRRYLATGRRMLARWTTRLVVFFLLLASGMPVLSAVAAAAIVLVQLAIHRRAFTRFIARGDCQSS